MHERSLARALLQQITELMLTHRAPRVRSVQLSVGEFSGIDANLLQAALTEIFGGTPAEGATVVIDQVPLEARCTDCELNFSVRAFQFVCPRCRGTRVDIMRGDELMLETMSLMESES